MEAAVENDNDHPPLTLEEILSMGAGLLERMMQPVNNEQDLMDVERTMNLLIRGFKAHHRIRLRHHRHGLLDPSVNVNLVSSTQARAAHDPDYDGAGRSGRAAGRRHHRVAPYHRRGRRAEDNGGAQANVVENAGRNGRPSPVASISIGTGALQNGQSVCIRVGNGENQNSIHICVSASGNNYQAGPQYEQPGGGIAGNPEQGGNRRDANDEDDAGVN